MAAVEVAVLAVPKQVGLRRITSGELLKKQKEFRFARSWRILILKIFRSLEFPKEPREGAQANFL